MTATPQAPDRSRAGIRARAGKGNRVHVLAGEWPIYDYKGTPIPVARFKCGATSTNPITALGEAVSCANCKRLIRVPPADTDPTGTPQGPT